MEKTKQYGLYTDFQFNEEGEFSVFGIDIIWPRTDPVRCGCVGQSWGFRLYLLGAGLCLAFTFARRNPKCLEREGVIQHADASIEQSPSDRGSLEDRAMVQQEREASAEQEGNGQGVEAEKPQEMTVQEVHVTPDAFRVTATWHLDGEGVTVDRYAITTEEAVNEMRSFYDIARSGTKGHWPQVNIEPVYRGRFGNRTV